MPIPEREREKGWAMSDPWAGQAGKFRRRKEGNWGWGAAARNLLLEGTRRDVTKVFCLCDWKPMWRF